MLWVVVCVVEVCGLFCFLVREVLWARWWWFCCVVGLSGVGGVGRFAELRGLVDMKKHFDLIFGFANHALNDAIICSTHK